MDIPDRQITSETVALMFKYAEDAVKDYRFITKVVDPVIKKCGGRDQMCKAKAIYAFVKNYVAYTLDPAGIELVQHPWVTLQRRKGDCDDNSVLVYAMLMAAGIPVRFQLWRRRPDKAFTHVNVGALIGKKWITIDTTLKTDGFDVDLSPSVMTPVYSPTIKHALRGMLISGDAEPKVRHPVNVVPGRTVLPGKDVDISNQVGRRPPVVGRAPISNFPSNVVYVEGSPVLTDFTSDTDPIPSVINEDVNLEEGLDRPLFDDIALTEDEATEVTPPWGLKELCS